MTCPTNPDGTAHRYRLPPQGTPGPGVCAYCGVEKTFAPPSTNPWSQFAPRMGRSRPTTAKPEQGQ